MYIHKFYEYGRQIWKSLKMKLLTSFLIKVVFLIIGSSTPTSSPTFNFNLFPTQQITKTTNVINITNVLLVQIVNNASLKLHDQWEYLE